MKRYTLVMVRASLQSIRSFLLTHELLIALLCLNALLRLPSLIEPYWYGDEGIYLTLGTAIRYGLHLYKDIHDNKPPGLYFLAAIAGSMFWFRFLLLLWTTVSSVLFHKLIHKLADRLEQPKAWVLAGVSFPIPRVSEVATFLFIVLPFLAEGNIANGEIFMILPTLLGMVILAPALGEKRMRWVPIRAIIFAALAHSAAFLIKVPSLFDAIAAGLVFFILPIWATSPLTLTSVPKLLRERLVPAIRTGGVFAIVFFIPVIASVLYYSALGAGKAYIAGAFAANVGYLSSWTTGTHSADNLGSSGLLNRGLALAVVTVLVLALSHKFKPVLTFALIWFAYAMFGALLSERPYPHYLIQIIPPLCLLIALSWQALRFGSKTQRIFSLVGIGLCLISIVVAQITIRFWHYPLPTYYGNYISFVTGSLSKEQYWSTFDPRLPAMYTLAVRIVDRTTPDDRIFAWGDIPMLYALTRRLPPGRYTSAYHINDFGGYEETTVAIEATKPKFIVVDTQTGYSYPDLDTILATDYIELSNEGPFALYSRLELQR